jgi:hypothetical protein
MMREWDTQTLGLQARVAGRSGRRYDVGAINEEIRRRRIALKAELLQLRTIRKEMKALYVVAKANKGKVSK